MVNYGLIVAGIIGVFIGWMLLANPGLLGTGFGYAFAIGGIIVFVAGLLTARVSARRARSEK
jgi:hypothetical protein